MADKTLHRLIAFVGAGACAALAATPAVAAAPAKRASAPARPAAKAAPAARLVSMAVLPSAVTLKGPRDEHGLIVTGKYSDGTVKDLTATAQYRVSNPGIAVVKTGPEGSASRRVVRPLANGSAVVNVTVPGAPPVTVKVSVEGAGELQPVSFRNEVVPALTKAGCNTGTCHGTPTGKGGFRLSLQGYAPELDYQSLAREGGARRINKADPGRSILLLKSMGMVAHGGGKRLYKEMPEYTVLVRWIAEGMQDDPENLPRPVKVELLPGRRQLKLPSSADARVQQQITAVAHYSDGSTRDVTSLAKLSTSNEDIAAIGREGLVEAQQRGEIAVICRYEDLLETTRLTFVQDVPGFRWEDPKAQNYIDGHVFDRLQLFQIPMSGLATDREFLRRAYLDTVGLLPTAEEARKFLADPDPKKRDNLIDELTARPEFADFWALKWADILRVQDETMKEQGAKAFHGWIRDSLAANKPMDEFVREILTSQGPTFTAAPANYYRQTEQPEVIAESTAQLFLGVRMACAKCHNHPFERWTQDEYYQFAAFFSQVARGRGKVKDEESIVLKPNAEVTHLRTGKVMRPKLLGAAFPEIAKGQDRRPVLAEWMTGKQNPFFAKAMVNRVWSYLLQRGIVEPVDDFRDSNPAVNDALLEALAKDFAEHNFDLRHIVRTIMRSRTYQTTARTVALNKTDETYFSHAATRLMRAEQLLDAITQLTGIPEQFPGYPMGTRAAQIAGTAARTQFLKTFGRPDRNLNCECEREKDPTLFQALTLISNPQVQGRISSEDGRIAKLATSNLSDEQVIEEMYLSAFTRAPSAKETKQWITHFSKTGSRRAALEDMGWVMINSKEFLFRY